MDFNCVQKVNLRKNAIKFDPICGGVQISLTYV